MFLSSVHDKIYQDNFLKLFQSPEISNAFKAYAGSCLFNIGEPYPQPQLKLEFDVKDFLK